MHIDSQFHGGNIEVLSQEGTSARLRIRPDVPTITMDGPRAHLQWFAFRAVGQAGVERRFVIDNAHEASYPDGWPGYRVAVSEDGLRWTRCDTRVEEGRLLFRHTPKGDLAWYAYFAPYGEERGQALLARAAARGARLEVLGQTLDGRALDLVTVGEGGPVVWVIARQHPGETMASYWVEGFLDRLLDPHDALAREARARALWFVVPNMNPDGSARGHLRVNAAGANLNRCWAEPSMESSPEVFLARGRMDQTGVDLCFDVHGDEGLPYVFPIGADGSPSWDERRQALTDRLYARYAQVCPDFQWEHGYPKYRAWDTERHMSTPALAERFGCVAVTLEMPFKDNANAPDLEQGWSPERSIRLGAAGVDALIAGIGL